MLSWLVTHVVETWLFISLVLAPLVLIGNAEIRRSRARSSAPSSAKKAGRA